MALWRRRTSRQKLRLTRVKRTRLLARKLCSSMWKRPNCIRDYAGLLFPLRRAFVPPYFRLDFGRCHEERSFDIGIAVQVAWIFVQANNQQWSAKLPG